MLTQENKDKLFEILKRRYVAVGQTVSPLPVSGEFVRQVLKGKKSSKSVEEACIEFAERLSEEAKEANVRVEQLIHQDEPAGQ